ncbi:formylglycine-generating enzyme family protein [Fastidiosibacter lacustris]|uniref:formylglycine-generating enzyme family protein n=1 Tax=Fastidiosibacter lacustris TaxID=2056695 RepID=UPI000E352919|nr:formylglycine-generating enzyme family protein [Fastidiosibacter lacustris]
MLVSDIKKIINQMDDREAMGLSMHSVDTRVPNLSNALLHIKKCNKHELVLTAESHELFEYRYAAGILLGLMGDPRTSTITPKMIEIPAGEVEIGININKAYEVFDRFNQLGVKKEWILKEVPKFTVMVKAFKVSKYLVTNENYYDFLLDTKYCELPSSWEFGIYPYLKSNHPVYSISDDAAISYTQWLSKKTGRFFRLPTEYEWEYAASGPAHYEYPWGNEYKPNLCNTLETGLYSSTPVGIFPKGNSPFGVSDMSGNVEEYVQDYYRPYPNGKAVIDDLGDIDEYRIARGGSFTRHHDLARTTRRHGRFSKDIYVMGFRLVEI